MQISQTRAKYYLLSVFGALVVAFGVLAIFSPPTQAQVGPPQCAPTILGEICIEKAVDPNPVGVGEPLTFTITLTETGLNPNVVDVTDVLPLGVEVQSVTVNPTGTGTCSETAPNTVSCDNLAVTTFSPTTVTIEAIPGQCGTFTNTAEGMADAGGEIADSVEFTVEGCAADRARANARSSGRAG